MYAILLNDKNTKYDTERKKLTSKQYENKTISTDSTILRRSNKKEISSDQIKTNIYAANKTKKDNLDAAPLRDINNHTNKRRTAISFKHFSSDRQQQP